MHDSAPGTPLPFDNCENFRELGGYIGYGGKTVKHGVLYRTGMLATIRTQHDRELLASLGLRLVIDLRSEPERVAAPDPEVPGARHLDLSAMIDENGRDVRFDPNEILRQGRQGVERMLEMVVGSYVHMPFRNPAYQVMLDEIRAGSMPLLFHCTAGKDRTGVAAAILLRALGVSREDVLRDYDLTNHCRPKALADFSKRVDGLTERQAQDMARCIVGVEVKNLAVSLDAIDARYPSFEAYLDGEYGFTAADVDALRAACLE